MLQNAFVNVFFEDTFQIAADRVKKKRQPLKSSDISPLLSENWERTDLHPRHYLSNYINHRAAMTSVIEAVASVRGSDSGASALNQSIMASNIIPRAAARLYSGESVLSVIRGDWSTLPLYVAEKDCESMLASIKRSWSELSFFTKLVIGFSPNNKGAATLCLLSNFNSNDLGKIQQLNGFDKSVLELLYGRLLYLSQVGSSN